MKLFVYFKFSLFSNPQHRLVMVLHLSPAQAHNGPEEGMLRLEVLSPVNSFSVLH